MLQVNANIGDKQTDENLASVAIQILAANVEISQFQTCLHILMDNKRTRKSLSKA